MAGRVIFVEPPGRSLEDNPLGDPTARRTPVYLPPSYDSEPARRYPVLFALAGYSATGEHYLNRHPWQPTLPALLDQMIAVGECEECIVVMPDCFTRWGGSQYLNSAGTGRYMDYLADDLVDFADRTFRTTIDGSGCAAVGISSGGYGALVLGMLRPDRFTAVASHSGDCYFEWCYKPDLLKLLGKMEAAGGIEELVRQSEANPYRGADIPFMNIIAMAACYSPDPTQPLGLALPFDTTSGELVPATWARWLEWDPVEMAPRQHQALRSLRLLYFDAGKRDEYSLQYGARVLASRLRALDVPFLHEEHDGTHSDLLYRFRRSLPLLVAALLGRSQ